MAVLSAPDLTASSGLTYSTALFLRGAIIVPPSTKDFLPAPNTIGGEGLQTPDSTAAYPF